MGIVYVTLIFLYRAVGGLLSGFLCGGPDGLELTTD